MSFTSRKWEEFMKNYEFLSRLGSSIKMYRVAAGLSQEGLSERTNCDKNTIGNIERGESDIRLTTLYRLAKGLDTSCSRIIKETEKTENDCFAATIEYDYLRLFQYCHQLSPEQFNNLCNTAHLYVKANVGSSRNSS